MGMRMGNSDEAVGYPVVHHHYYVPIDSPPILVRRRRRCCRGHCAAVAYVLSLLALGTAGWALWPGEVKVEVRKTELVGMSWDNAIRQHQRGNDNDLGEGRLELDLNLKFRVQLRVRNPNLFGVRYDRIVVGLGYRGDGLGRVVLEGGEVPPLKVVTVDGEMDLKGSKVIAHAARMMLDIAKGRLPLETDLDFSGDLELLFLRPHLKARLSCDIVVNPDTNDILDQSCLLGE